MSLETDQPHRIVPPPQLLFTYGTLQAGEVWRAVVGHDSPAVDAAAPGWAALAVAGQPYPALRASRNAGASAPGRLYGGLHAEDLARLDRFEGAEYERRPILVRLASGVEVSADCYVGRPEPFCRTTNEPWTLERFLAEGGLDRFRRRHGGFGRLEV